MDGKTIVRTAIGDDAFDMTWGGPLVEMIDAALASDRQEEREKRASVELAYRRELWLGHGHIGMYGDDGEMQCSECMQYGVIDYKRAPLEQVEQACFLARTDRASAAIRARTP